MGTVVVIGGVVVKIKMGVVLCVVEVDKLIVLELVVVALDVSELVARLVLGLIEELCKLEMELLVETNREEVVIEVIEEDRVSLVVELLDDERVDSSASVD
jgi:hypothetical protein